MFAFALSLGESGRVFAYFVSAEAARDLPPAIRERLDCFVQRTDVDYKKIGWRYLTIGELCCVFLFAHRIVPDADLAEKYRESARRRLQGLRRDHKALAKIVELVFAAVDAHIKEMDLSTREFLPLCTDGSAIVQICTS